MQLPDPNRQGSAAAAPTNPVPHHSAVLDSPNKSGECHGDTPRLPTSGSPIMTTSEVLIWIEPKLPTLRETVTQKIVNNTQKTRSNTGHRNGKNTNLAEIRVIETNCRPPETEIENVTKNKEHNSTTIPKYIPPIEHKNRTD